LGEKLNNIYPSINIIRLIKSRKISWARQAARMGEMRHMLHNFISNTVKEKYHLEDLGVYKRTVLVGL
jgi:hypothetical protein